jgi:RNA polymerase sigma-70 factor (sigma-E family)
MGTTTMEAGLPPSAPGDFEEFAISSLPALLRFAHQLSGDLAAAEDLVQSALLKTWQAWHRLERLDDPAAYARRVIVNAHLTWWRRRGRREDRTSDPPDTAVRAGDDAVVDRELVLTALNDLSPRQRAVIVLRYFEDLSEADTAALMSCSTGTVKSQTAKALARLRRTLGPEAGHGGDIALTTRRPG